MRQYVAASEFDPGHPTVLAIYCSDGRFTGAVEELTRKLGHDRLDTLTIPGGPALLNLASAGFCDSDAVGRATSFLVRGHKISRVLVLAHAGCGYYRARLTGRKDAAIRQHQLDDLRAAASWLKLSHPGVEVLAFYAYNDKKRIVFDPLEQGK